MCLCVSNSIVPLATIAFTAGFPMHTAFELKVTEYLVHARSSFLKRPVSLLEPTIFKTIFKQNTQVSDKANDADSAGEMMPPEHSAEIRKAEQCWSACSPPGRWMLWVTGEIRSGGGGSCWAEKPSDSFADATIEALFLC